MLHFPFLPFFSIFHSSSVNLVRSRNVCHRNSCTITLLASEGLPSILPPVPPGPWLLLPPFLPFLFSLFLYLLVLLSLVPSLTFAYLSLALRCLARSLAILDFFVVIPMQVSSSARYLICMYVSPSDSVCVYVRMRVCEEGGGACICICECVWCFPSVRACSWVRVCVACFNRGPVLLSLLIGDPLSSTRFNNCEEHVFGRSGLFVLYMFMLFRLVVTYSHWCWHCLLFLIWILMLSLLSL